LLTYLLTYLLNLRIYRTKRCSRR